MARDLRDKVILITGASSGIGAATALACAEAGMRVSLVARRGDKLEQIARQIALLRHKAHYFSADVCIESDMRQAFDACWEAFGRLDAVFANAGYGRIAEMSDTPEHVERAMFETNYFGTTRTLRLAMPLLRDTPDGLRHVLVCSSAASEVGLPMGGVYSATKAAQDSVAGAMRAELHDEGYRVTTVHPIGTKTEFMDVAGEGSAQGNTPAGLQQTPEKVAKHIVKALRKPRPEVWPSRATRYLLALGTASPRFASWVMRRHYRKIKRAERAERAELAARRPRPEPQRLASRNETTEKTT